MAQKQLHEISAGMTIGGRKVILATMDGTCPMCGRYIRARQDLIIVNKGTDGQSGRKRWNHAGCDPDVLVRDAELIAKKAQAGTQMDLFKK